jgi:crossover junction endodeoxyribonuclease RusA
MTPSPAPRETLPPTEFARADPEPELAPALEFELPWPPSVNHYWRSPSSGPLAGRTLLSAAGRAYRQRVEVALLVQRVPRRELVGHLEIFLLAHEPAPRRRRDLDNLLKPVLDGLTHARVIADDLYFDRITIARGAACTSRTGGLLRVWLGGLGVGA